MLRTLLATFAATLALASPAAAEVVARTADGFTLRYATPSTVPADAIPVGLSAISRWWDGSHSYSGSAANISLDLTPGGCWCEALSDGRVFEHARVVSIEDTRIVMNAPLGPLNGKATRADLVMTWSPDGSGLTWNFVVEGPGLGSLADSVDFVMTSAFTRYVRFLEHGPADAAASPPSPGS